MIVKVNSVKIPECQINVSALVLCGQNYRQTSLDINMDIAYSHDLDNYRVLTADS